MMRHNGMKGAAARTFLGRLRGDRGGNVLAMAAAALIPLLAMVGGAIDASRFYMARTRLQQACDAGALAGRKAMATVTVLSDTEKAKANEFFDFNYPTGTYSSTNITRTYSKGGDGVVVGSAAADVPTSIMKFFGFGSLNLTVACQSTLNIPNTDVMFVLDVTGSMKDVPTGDTVSKLDGVKQAVKDFYAALGPGAASGPGRVRYGFMPYSSNVNVGRILYAANPGFIAGGNGTEYWHYQSRTAVTVVDHYVASTGPESSQSYNDPTYSSSNLWSGYSDVSSAVGSYPASYSNLTSTQCEAKAAPPETISGGYGTPSVTSTDPVNYPDTTQTTNYSSSASGTETQYDYYRKGLGTYGTCQLRKRTRGSATATRTSTTTHTVTWADRNKFDHWNYHNVLTSDDHPIDVSPFVQNSGAMNNPAYWSGYYAGSDPNEGAPASFSWGGCIEEAQTVNTITSGSSITPPSEAYDLNIDLIPNSAETRWKPFLRELGYSRSGTDHTWLADSTRLANGWNACPREASRLTMYASDYNATTKSSTIFNNYVNSLTAIGGTYHDVGLMWGARFMSPTGIFASDNADSAAPGGYQVSRHIVFMTDGALSTYNDNYDQWGINYMEGRTAPTGSDNTALNAAHSRRIDIICNAMKSKGFTIWIIGFGIADLDQQLKDCATDANHWSVAANSTALRARFSAIAQTVGGLRLSQ